MLQSAFCEWESVVSSPSGVFRLLPGCVGFAQFAVLVVLLRALLLLCFWDFWPVISYLGDFRRFGEEATRCGNLRKVASILFVDLFQVLCLR